MRCNCIHIIITCYNIITRTDQIGSMGEASDTLKAFTEIIREEFNRYSIPISSIYLFGSRATGNHRPDSDWDFLIITSDEVDAALKRRILSQIRRRLVFEYDSDSDLLVLPEKSVPRAKKGYRDTVLLCT